MMMPAHPTPDADPGRPGVDSSGSLKFTTLRQRAQFLMAAKAQRAGTPGFLLQARKRAPDEPAEAPIRVGYTCSRKIGNAVARNRAKRRLRAMAREVLAQRAQPGWDYVLVGRPQATIDRDFSELCEDLRRALERIHNPKPAK